jgi:hypothetical protein
MGTVGVGFRQRFKIGKTSINIYQYRLLVFRRHSSNIEKSTVCRIQVLVKDNSVPQSHFTVNWDLEICPMTTTRRPEASPRRFSSQYRKRIPDEKPEATKWHKIVRLFSSSSYIIIPDEKPEATKWHKIVRLFSRSSSDHQYDYQVPFHRNQTTTTRSYRG